ncbi:MAG: 3-deoxy-manno-octulosonate cytidylyltransferase [Candidatus Marinimicrobia bacterium]|nr:3-deoxy-manno-octulosonate cytidylyltransferase [Candidatus Neomarinimicrobiota bacterium]
MKIIGIIPVRLESTRLPQKAIADISGLPMFVHTYKRAKLSKTLEEVYLATDSLEIKKIASDYSIKTIMTSTSHKNSSERIAEACKAIDCEIVVNIQGDEPLLYPEHIDKIIHPMINDNNIQVSIGITRFNKQESTSDIKAAIDLNNNILYCSRADIPHSYNSINQPMWKLVFIVPHRKECIMNYLKWNQTPLELIEDNHFLRLIENGISIKAVEVIGAKISVDTKEDLNEVRSLMKKDSLFNRNYH